MPEASDSSPHSRTPASFEQELAIDSQSFLPQCNAHYLPDNTYYCFGGDLTSSTTVALVGDSHAGMWFNALSDVGTKEGFRVLLLSESDCPFIPVEVRIGPDAVVDTSQCVARTSEGMRYLRTIKPEAVILAQHDFYVGSILDNNGNIPSTLSRSCFGNVRSGHSSSKWMLKEFDPG